MDYAEEDENIIEEQEEIKENPVDYRAKYKKRVEEEEERSKENRLKREHKKAKEAHLRAIQINALKNQTTGLITWKQDTSGLPNWIGYVNNEKCFKISQGIYKYSLSSYIKTLDKKDKSIKTSFELNKLQVIAEKVALKIPPISKKEEETK